MTEQEEKLVEQYLRDMKKQRFVILLISFILVIVAFVFFKEYMKRNNNFVNTNNEIIEIEEKPNNELVVMNSIQIENEVIQTNVIDNTIVDSILEEPVEKKEVNKADKIENISNESIKPTPQVKTTIINEKPSNKDFLFVDGYTMENVTQVAQDYLKSSGYAGECVPLKDSDGVYIGMKVIFY